VQHRLRVKAQLRCKKRQKTLGYHKAKKMFDDDILIISDIEKVVSWCLENDILVHFTGTSGLYTHASKTITVSSRMNTKNQLHILLHEVGHYLISQEPENNRYTTSKTSTQYKIDTLEEEFEAWTKGLRLAHELKINIDEPQFNKMRSSMLMTYVEWANR
jgi:hypothetical protein